MHRQLGILLILIASLLTPNAKASQLNIGAEKALRMEAQIVSQLSGLEVDALQEALEQMITISEKALLSEGHKREASVLRNEWSKVKAWLISEDLGDHRPLSKWWAHVYNIVERVLGPARMSQLHLDDIFVINFAVPVVIDPRGDWNKREYSRHFVPLAGVVVFWSSIGACMNGLAGTRGSFAYCERVATLLKRGMSTGIGPMLSNFVFDRFNSRDFKGIFPIRYEDLVRMHGRELERL